MNAPTAASILKQLDAHRLGAQMQALAALDTAAQSEVRRALTAVRGSARIDVPRLIESIRQTIAEQAKEQRKPGQPWRYAITLMSDDQREEFRRLVQGGSDPDAAAQSVMKDKDYASRLRPADTEVDDAADEDAPPKRRSIPRRRLLRAEREPEAKKQLKEIYFGPRTFFQFRA